MIMHSQLGLKNLKTLDHISTKSQGQEHKTLASSKNFPFQNPSINQLAPKII
jgi:hypothetical protein